MNDIVKTRASSDSDRNALKTAWKRMLGTLGGLEATAACTRASKSRLAEYGAVQAADTHAPIDVILDCERIAGTPFVTETLARLQGYLLLPIEMPGDGDVACALQTVATDAGATLSDSLSALAGGMEPAKMLGVQADLTELVRAAQNALSLVTHRIGTAPLKPRAVESTSG